MNLTINPLIAIERSLRFPRHRLFPKKTYADHRDELIIEALIGRVDKFIDIGAYDGFHTSNTFLFALKGARGLCFEPLPSLFFGLKYLYFFNKKVICINEGISEKEQIFEIRNDGLISSIIKTEVSAHKEYLKKIGMVNEQAPIENIICRPLDYWLSTFKDFLDTDVTDIDVEGHELMVLKGIDFSQFKTKCFVIEQGSIAAGWIHRDYDEINLILKNAGYTPAVRNKRNFFWVRNDILDEKTINNVIQKFSNCHEVKL